MLYDITNILNAAIDCLEGARYDIDEATFDGLVLPRHPIPNILLSILYGGDKGPVEDRLENLKVKKIEGRKDFKSSSVQALLDASSDKISKNDAFLHTLEWLCKEKEK